MKNKNSAAMLAFWLGGVGVHKFYLGETGWGIAYALFFWTYIPAIAGFIESIMLVSMSEADFEYKYNHRSLAGQESRYLTNNPPPPQAIANYPNTPNSLLVNETLSAENIDRQILRLCKEKGEMTLLDCFLELDNIPKRILEVRLESLVREEFLEISNRESDGKVVYRLDN